MSRMRNIQVIAREAADAGAFDLVGVGGPLSGSASRADALPTGFGIAGFGATYTDLTNGAVYLNEGTPTNIYWTPQNVFQPGILGVMSDFRDGVGKANADTAAAYTIPGSGVRVFGDDVTQTDSGFAVAQAAGGAVGTLQATATSGKIAALGGLMTNATAVPFSPATNGPLVIDCLITNSSAITLRRMFLGFLGTGADALLNPYSGSTLTITQVQADSGGLFFDVGLTAGTELFAPHNKASEAATILTTATGVDTGTTIAAAGTYQRLRVEVSAAGVMTCFVDKIQVTQISAAFTAATGLQGCLVIGSTSSAVKALLVKKFGVWGVRAQGV